MDTTAAVDFATCLGIRRSQRRLCTLARIAYERTEKRIGDGVIPSLHRNHACIHDARVCTIHSNSAL